MVTFFQLHLASVPARYLHAETKWFRPFELGALHLLRLCRYRGYSFNDEPHVLPLEDFEVALNDLPESLSERLEELRPEITAAGFSPAEGGFHDVPHPVDPAQRLYRITLKHSKLPAYLRLNWTAFKGRRVREVITVFSMREDLSWFLSRNGPIQLYPESWTIDYHDGASIEDLWRAHRKHLRTHAGDFLKAGSPAEASADFHHEMMLFLRKSDHVTPLPEASVRVGAVPAATHPQPAPVFAAKTSPASSSPAVPQAEALKESSTAPREPVSNTELQTISAEVGKQDRSSLSWKHAALISVVFMLILAPWNEVQTQTWTRALIVVGVIFFHELGHYLAMRAFGYKNVRLLIIPFVGGAAIGRNRHVAGWKKVVVYLMGPLPGILAGTALGIYGYAEGASLFTEIAAYLLLINGLNLLPILPLDGGHILQETIFKRNPVLELSFHIFAIVLLATLGHWLLPLTIQIFLVVTLGFSLPATWRSARIARALRSESPLPIKSDCGGIHESTLRPIVNAIHATWPSGMLNPKSYATVAIGIYERAVSRPPTAFASLAFLGLQGASFAVALVFGITFFAIGNGVEFEGPATAFEETPFDWTIGAEADQPEWEPVPDSSMDPGEFNVDQATTFGPIPFETGPVD